MNERPPFSFWILIVVCGFLLAATACEHARTNDLAREVRDSWNRIDQLRHEIRELKQKVDNAKCPCETDRKCPCGCQGKTSCSTCGGGGMVILSPVPQPPQFVVPGPPVFGPPIEVPGPPIVVHEPTPAPPIDPPSPEPTPAPPESRLKKKPCK